MKDGSNESAKAVKGASVDVNGSILKTNDSGVAVFNLRKGDYPIKIKKAGHKTINDIVMVAEAAVSKTIVLPEA